MIDQGGVPGLSDPNQIASPEDYLPKGRKTEGDEVGTQLPNNETPEEIARGQQIDPNNRNLQLEPLGSNLPTDKDRLGYDGPDFCEGPLSPSSLLAKTRRNSSFRSSCHSSRLAPGSA
jgi:hypothetical protein